MAGSVELVVLAETEGTSKKPTKAMKFSAQVTQCFNIMGLSLKMCLLFILV